MSQPYVNTSSLSWHTAEMPWSLQYQKMSAGFYAKLNASSDVSLPTTLFKQQASMTVLDPVMDIGKQACSTWGIPEYLDSSKPSIKKKWKFICNSKLCLQHKTNLSMYREMDVHNGSRRSDAMMITTMIDA